MPNKQVKKYEDKPAKADKQNREPSFFIDSTDCDNFVEDGEFTVSYPATQQQCQWLYPLNNGLTEKATSFLSMWNGCAEGFSALGSIASGAITKHVNSGYKPLFLGSEEKRTIYLRETLPASKVNYWNIASIISPDRSAKDCSCRCTPYSFESSSERENIFTKVSVLCPEGSEFEIWEIELNNKSTKKRTLDLFTHINWNPQKETALPYPTEALEKTIHHKNGCITNSSFVAKNRITAWLIAGNEPEGFEISEIRWQGTAFPLSTPESVITGKLSSKQIIEPKSSHCAALHFRITLPASGAWRTYIAVGAIFGTIDEACSVAERVKKNNLSQKGFQALLRQKQNDWRKLSSSLLLKSPSDDFNRHFNVWTKQQLITATLFGDGNKHIEFRDRMRLIEALVPVSTAAAKRLLLDSIRFQMKDGRIVNSIPLHNGYMPENDEAALDNGIWMCNAALRFITETGDLDFLETQVPFYDPRIKEFETIRNGKVYDHLMASLRCMFDFRGKLGFCKNGCHDPVRALTQSTKQGSVSVALTASLLHTAKLMLEIAKRKGQKRDIGYINSLCANIQSNLDNYGWNGSHYNYSYDDAGKVVGGTNDQYGRIFLLAQVWALLSGAADAAGKGEEVLKAIEQLDTVHGIKTLSPPYPEGFSEKGGISTLPVGYFENGGIELYCQGLTAYVYANRGMGNRAWETIKKFLPSINQSELPIQLPEFKIGPDDIHAAGTPMYNNFNSGIAAFRLAMERIAGVLPSLQGLILSPSIPSDWKEFEVKKKWRGITFSVKYHNPAALESGIKKATANGKELGRDSSGHFIITYDTFKEYAKSDKQVCIDALIG